jgi:hypothetical protein
MDALALCMEPHGAKPRLRGAHVMRALSETCAHACGSCSCTALLCATQVKTVFDPKSDLAVPSRRRAPDACPLRRSTNPTCADAAIGARPARADRRSARGRVDRAGCDRGTPAASSAVPEYSQWYSEYSAPYLSSRAAVQCAACGRHVLHLARPGSSSGRYSEYSAQWGYSEYSEYSAQWGALGVLRRRDKQC